MPVTQASSVLVEVNLADRRGNVTVAMGMIITNFWKIFHYRVNIGYYEKLIGIRKLLE